MKTYSKVSVLIVAILLLSACAGTASATPEAALQNVYTAAALTLAVQASNVTATTTTMPTIVLPTTQMLPTYNSSLPTSTTAPSLVSYSANSTTNGCNNSVYVSDVTIPDGTVLTAGEAFTKTWQLQNTGTCDWDENYLVVFVSGSQMDGESTEIDQDVVSGATGDISVSLVAPSTAGTYTGYWKMADSDGTSFGQSVYVQIMVSSTSTSTATATSTTESDEATSTPTPTTQATSTFTAVTAPTSTPTETPTPSSATSE